MTDNIIQFPHRQEYLYEILEHFHDGIYITDNEANTIYLNHSYERISGLKVSDMLGKNMKALVEQGVISMSGTLQVLETGEEVTMEQSFSTGRQAIITSTPLFRQTGSRQEANNEGARGDIIMVVTIVREMTELYSIRKEMRIQEQLKLKYRSELEQLRQEYIGKPVIVSEAASTRELMRMVDHVRMVDAPIFLTGEKGSGKRRIAAYIHEYSKRSGKAFIGINFNAIPMDDPAGYLFGRRTAEGEYQIGMLESAAGGTVYFENLGEMPVIIQDRILSLLRDGQCVMGDGTVRRVDIRIIAGSNESLEYLRKMKKVSPDIIYAFSMFVLKVPPLRERKDDIVPLAEHFLERSNKERGASIRISKGGYEGLLAYSWPENVLELENMVTRAAIICRGNTITEEDLFLGGHKRETGATVSIAGELPPQMDLREEVAALEAAYMTKAFEKFGNLREAARYLGIDASTFTRKRQKYRQMGLM
ncbi:MAG: sigma 54-interacting transcriptional regulator [Lachnospiraceae bacterium]|jgi:PAS domain S-box-containing protein